MLEPADREMEALTAQIARDVAGLGVALLAAHQVVATVRTQLPMAGPALAGLLPLCAEGGATLIKLGGLLGHSVLLERGEWDRLVAALGEPALPLGPRRVLTDVDEAVIHSQPCPTRDG